MLDSSDLTGTSELQSFECPRCTAVVTERLWGPCAACRHQLSENVRGQAAELETSRFEPGMHVVPNHVATKD